MKVYGQLERAQAELLASDPTGAGLINGRVWYNTTASKLNFYDGAVRSIVSENGTQTLTNKTLSGNIAATLSPDGVESLTLPAVTDTFAVLAAAQTLSNKSLPTINFPHQTTPATPASGNSKLYVKGDRKAYLLDEEGNEIAIGTGGGGLDIFHTEDFSVNNAADLDSGDNPTFLGGGTLAGTLADFSDSLGNRRLRYTQAANSLDDYFAGPAFDVPEKARGNKILVKFVYKYDGLEGDIKPEVYDVTNGASLISETVSIKPFGALKVFEVYVDVPSTCASMRWGFHVKTLNSGAILEVDDIQFNADGLAPAEYYANSDWIEYTPTIEGLGTVTNLQANYRRDGGDLIVRGWANAGTPTAVALTISLPTGLNIDPDRLPAKANKRNRVGEITRIEAGQRHYGQGGIAHTETPGSTTKVYYSTLPSFDFEFTTNVGTDFATGDGMAWEFRVPIQGWSNVERGVSVRGFENVDNENEFSMKSDGASVISESLQGVFGLTNPTAGTFTIDYSSLGLTEIPVITINGHTAGDGSNFNVFRGVGLSSETLTQCTVYTGTSSSGGTATTRSNFPFAIKLTKQGADFVKDHERTVVLPNGLQNPVAVLKDVKPNSINGGSSINGDQVRDLNVLEGDTSFISLDSGTARFTLQPGEYFLEGSSPSWKVNYNLIYIFNVTDTTNPILGTAEYTETSDNVITRSFLDGFIKITEPKVFELRHVTSIATASNGLGVGAGKGVDELFSVLKITKRS